MLQSQQGPAACLLAWSVQEEVASVEAEDGAETERRETGLADEPVCWSENVEVVALGPGYWASDVASH